jgi:AcrR family transcriptional regulator
MKERKKTATRAKAARNTAESAKPPASPRERIMEAAFGVLMEQGYARASTLEIVTRAKVSKRELYALFGDKRGVLVEMIARRSARMHQALTLPPATDRAGLAETLVDFGATVLIEVCHPTVAAMFRLAISESDRSAEMAHVLDDNGRGAHRRALVAFLSQMGDADLLGDADPDIVANQFLALLFGDTLLRVVLRAIEPPSPRECRRRAQAATAAVLQLHPPVNRT